MATIMNTTLDDIAAVIGFTATIRLAAHYGGRDMNVPVAVSDKHMIAKLVGMSALQRLHAEWAGERVTMPTLGLVATDLRNARILRDLMAGVNLGVIAERESLTNRRVEQLRRAFEADGLLPMILGGKIDPEIAPEN